MTTLQFLGGAGTTTGSKHLLTHNGRRVLVDCGLFQGFKELRQLNWAPFPMKAQDIQDVILTHAHIDHCGHLPRLVLQGYEGPVHATSATADLVPIMLLDSAKIQMEDAAFANKKRFTRHAPALPLYSIADAEKAIERLRPHGYENEVKLNAELSFVMRDAGHILGSATLEIRLATESRGMSLIFSGDLGRYNTPILRDPVPITEADYLVIESTYGNRLHETEPPSDALGKAIRETAARGGSIIIPAFAVGRSQTLLYLLRELREQKAVPDIPVYLDSPMAVNSTNIFRQHSADFDAETLQLIHAGNSPFAFPGLRLIQSVEESKALNTRPYPCVIISSSGMATSGRVLHHLRWRLPDPRNTVLLVGYQAAGTRGHRLLVGEKQLKIHGEVVPVRAEVRNIGGLSAHADYHEILMWLRNFKRPPRQTFIVHGEPECSAGLAEHIQKELGWPTYRPHLKETVTLEP
ncbi:MAG: MBL fold metallo-hydrolase [Acidobacteria bacterium]|nr:MBL fold metallo-hydrolase [Acidobacteriota bacterium]